MDVNVITGKIIGCAVEVHKHLGPGLLESSYEACLYYELSKAGLFVERQVALPLVYKEVYLEHGYRIDLRVEKQVVIEIKVVEVISDVHVAQVLTYLKLSGSKIGLIINFQVLKLTNGIKRLISRN